MARTLHCRRTPKGLRFREFDAERKTYVTPEMSQPPLRLYLVGTGIPEDEADRLIRRAQMAGTSEPADKFNPDGNWIEEKPVEEPAPVKGA